MWFNLFFCTPWNSRGQASMEVMIAIAVLLIFFAAILFQNSFMRDDSEVIAVGIAENSECMKLAYLISEVYSNGKGSEATIEINVPTKVLSAQRMVNVGEHYCKFLANSSDYDLGAGTFNLKNSNGSIVFTSV